MTAYWKQDCRGGCSLRFSLFVKICVFSAKSLVSTLPGTVLLFFISFHPRWRGGVGGGEGGRVVELCGWLTGMLWTFTGSSQECVLSRGARRGGGRGQTAGCGGRKVLLFTFLFQSTDFSQQLMVCSVGTGCPCSLSPGDKYHEGTFILQLVNYISTEWRLKLEMTCGFHAIPKVGSEKKKSAIA